MWVSLSGPPYLAELCCHNNNKNDNNNDNFDCTYYKHFCLLFTLLISLQLRFSLQQSQTIFSFCQLHVCLHRKTRTWVVYGDRIIEVVEKFRVVSNEDRIGWHRLYNYSTHVVSGEISRYMRMNSAVKWLNSSWIYRVVKSFVFLLRVRFVVKPESQQ